MHPIVLEELAKDHRSDLMREAGNSQLVKLARAGQPGAAVRLLDRLGSLLVKIGGQLQKRHAPKSTGPLGWVKN